MEYAVGIVDGLAYIITLYTIYIIDYFCWGKDIVLNFHELGDSSEGTEALRTLSHLEWMRYPSLSSLKFDYLQLIRYTVQYTSVHFMYRAEFRLPMSKLYSTNTYFIRQNETVRLMNGPFYGNSSEKPSMFKNPQTQPISRFI